MPKRPPSNERVPSPDRGSLTDEWGIYDPAKAGMQALYARLGRPVLRESAKKARLERRRGFRPERPNDGVGLAIQEAMLRAGVMEPKEDPGAPMSPARAVRVALKATRPPKVEATAETESSSTNAAAQDLAAFDAPKRRPARRAKSSTTATAEAAAVPVEGSSPTRVTEIEPVSKARAPRKSRARAKVEPPSMAAAPVAPGPPAPSPRRPRGPVPLAAWAHAVTDPPKPTTRRGDKRGFWKGLFRMPTDVALVEYAHGCRIHRLLIETSDDVPLLDLL